MKRCTHIKVITQITRTGIESLVWPVDMIKAYASIEIISISSALRIKQTCVKIKITFAE